MKKIMSAVLAGAFAMSAFAQEQPGDAPLQEGKTVTPSLVYDYKAPIKRIDAKYALKSIKGYEVKPVTEQYAVASDTISGYIVIPACVMCDFTNGIEQFASLDGVSAIAYLTRTGDKYSKKAKLPFVLKDDKAKATAAIFGAYVIDGNDKMKVTAPQASIKNANKAWMVLSYNTNYEPKGLDSAFVLGKNYSGTTMGLGFLGLDNEVGTTVENAGFGTAKILSFSTKGSWEFCDFVPGSSSSCQQIDSISGTLVGNPVYAGMCGITPMWDLCYTTGQEAEGSTAEVPVWDVEPLTGPINQAVICGTWTLKFNASLTKAYAATGEDAILKKLKATANDIVEAKQ